MLPSNYIKHQSKNPLQQYFIRRFYDRLLQYADVTHPKRILDAGCGEGFTLSQLAEHTIGTILVGIDTSAEALKLSAHIFPKLHVRQGSIYTIPYADHSFDLVICTEVLEHLEDTARALSELGRVSRGYVLLSVPWEPWFRLTNFFLGKYVRRWGNHPEHVHQWTRKQFEQLLQKHGFKIVNVTTSFPWTVVLAKK
jgi:2-polyprenyl-3-methyl-5-hydroxy-6-metoxy-1,4-benzoquinol methylase